MNDTDTETTTDLVESGEVESVEKKPVENEPVENKPGENETGVERSSDTRRTVSIRLPRASWNRKWILAIVGTLLVVGCVVSTVMAVSARSDLSDLRTDIADRRHAEEVAGKYAVSAATLDYRDLTPWVANMKRGVSPDLQKQYDVIGETMEQVLGPLRMQTSAELVVAKAVDVAGDIFRVQAVVNVNTKTIQTPNGAVASAIYAVTLDRGKNWLITSVGDPTGGGNFGAASGATPPGAGGAPGAGTAPAEGAPGAGTAPAEGAPAPNPGG